ncbi:MAG: hypothetical protein OXH70_17365 [Acidobacteria bacterium]|nr:hypothetical protein [Acidobacteriota bacterium]
MSGLADLTSKQRADAAAKAQASKRAVSSARKAAGVPAMGVAVAAFCAECIYDPGASGAGSWRAQVAACESSRCPLWPYRPGNDALTELGGDFEARPLRAVLADKRAAYAEAGT